MIYVHKYDSNENTVQKFKIRQAKEAYKCFEQELNKVLDQEAQNNPHFNHFPNWSALKEDFDFYGEVAFMWPDPKIHKFIGVHIVCDNEN